MDDFDIDTALRTLGYTREWLDYGFLDEDLLRQQLVVYGNGEDRITEHYRYAAFCHIFGRAALSDVEIDRLLRLVRKCRPPFCISSSTGSD